MVQLAESDTSLRGPYPRSPFVKRTDVLAKDLVKSQSSEIVCYNDRMAVKFDK